VLKTLLVIVIITAADVYIRSESTNEGIAKYVPCGYLSLLINDYDNSSACKTVAGVIIDKKASYAALEKEIVDALSIFIPRKISLSEMLNSPEIDFIQSIQRERVPFRSLFDSLSSIYTYVPSNEYQLECSNFDGKEDGNFSIKCNIYGSSIPCITSECKSSRQVALKFFDEISRNNSFRYLNYPRTLNIEKFSSSELNARSTFGTVTNLSLSLKYIPSPLNPLINPNK
jgi:hypothetical protein